MYMQGIFKGFNEIYMDYGKEEGQITQRALLHGKWATRFHRDLSFRERLLL